MPLILSLAAAFVFGTAAAGACAWGYTGHEVVGAIADQMLTLNARTKVREIAGMNLQSASKWADCVKGVVQAETGTFKYVPDSQYQDACAEFEPAGGIALMEDYVKRNWDNCVLSPGSEPCHRQYHYTDIAIQNSRYDRSHAGTRDHDIVGSINAAIAILQGKRAPAPYSIKDAKEALLLLAHFVGDVHQPLHAGAIYIAGDGQPINPDAPGNKPGPETTTRGGNLINAGSGNLHALWDAIPASITPAAIHDKLLKRALAVAATPGEIAAWPVHWATESLKLSNYAYANMTFRRDTARPEQWVAEFSDPKKYMAARAGIQERQLTRAGARLAHVLNAIWP